MTVVARSTSTTTQTASDTSPANSGRNATRICMANGSWLGVRGGRLGLAGRTRAVQPLHLPAKGVGMGRLPDPDTDRLDGASAGRDGREHDLSGDVGGRCPLF